MMNRREAGKILALAAGALVTGSARAFAGNRPAAAAMQEQNATRAADSVGVDNLMSERWSKYGTRKSEC